MQHYELPTRLLDWTKSPLIGLYFALEPDAAQLATVPQDRAVWVIDPYDLNNVIHNKNEIAVVRSDAGSQFNTDGEVHTYLPLCLRDSKTAIAEKPMAIDVGSARVFYRSRY
jgi:hypothetical protein